MDRNRLISYSVHYKGEYHKIVKAIKDDEDIHETSFNECFTILDGIYPKSFLELRYPPFVIYYKGNLELLKDRTIAIVGSREPCEYALRATEALCRKNSDMVVVSGLAKGIDACAHQNASKTIGILGCGIDYIYPMCNKNLIENVVKEGLLMSEYPALSKPLAYHFPFRNRLIACLGERVYVMQSSSRSGTMTTINEALELGRDVKVLPYDVFNESGINNNHLILEGAQIIENEEIAI